ncbi:MAG: InlB B-repeat-containing protein [Acholeplasmataceae bacterium]|nr:InlB B-repeat-containing protein [Acholeplasmataceae bacterium]
MKKILSFIAIFTLVVLLAGCERNEFTVTFNSNGGSEVASVVVSKDATLTQPTAPTKADYVLEGWYKESALTNKWNFATDTVTANITLYAKWEVEETDQDKVDEAYDWLSIGDISALMNSSPRLILPTIRDGVTIAWDIDKPEYINPSNGNITQPVFEIGNQLVTLTATISYGTANERDKVFEATVLALPSLEETEPLIYETFEDYEDGNIIGQVGPWGPVSDKTGNSQFTVVSEILGYTIPEDSKALKIEAYLELQVEAPILHSYDYLVFEVDLFQPSTSDTSSIHIQTSSGSPVIGFGLNGRNLYYRVDNGDMIGIQVQSDKWYTARLEVDLVNKTIELFYYQDNGQLMSITPGPVQYSGSTQFQSIFIRSGSSGTPSLQNPAYITNINVNRPEALSAPETEIALGTIIGIEPVVSLEIGTPFVPSTPIVRSFFGSPVMLTEDVDYTLDIDHNVDVDVVGEYQVVYTFTSIYNALDIKTVNQTVSIYQLGTPNEITATDIGDVFNDMFDFTVTVERIDGTLYYVVTTDETMTVEDIVDHADVVTVLVETLDVSVHDVPSIPLGYIHFVVDADEFYSGVVSEELVQQTTVSITTTQEFYDMATNSSTGTKYILENDLDFAEFTWTPVSHTFDQAVFDGQGFKVSNIDIDGTGLGVYYAGIFHQLRNSVVKNIVVEDATVVSAGGRGAILVGQTHTGTILIENIVVLGGSVISNQYAAAIAGRANGSATTIIRNIAVVGTTLESTYTGGIIGYSETSALYISDVYVSVEFGVLTSDRSGGVVARVKPGFETIIERVSVDSVLRTSNHIGGVVGQDNASGASAIDLTIIDVFFTGSLTAPSRRGSVIGEARAVPAVVVTNAWEYNVVETPDEVSAGLDGTAIDSETTVDASWFATNLPNMANSDLWAVLGDQIILKTYYEMIVE